VTVVIVRMARPAVLRTGLRGGRNRRRETRVCLDIRGVGCRGDTMVARQ
jgi:predicted SpoU family rRNA methylase